MERTAEGYVIQDPIERARAEVAGNGFSYRGVAAAAGLSHNCVRLALQGRHSPSVRNMARIRAALDLMIREKLERMVAEANEGGAR